MKKAGARLDVSIDPQADAPAAVAAFASDPHVEYAQPDDKTTVF